MSMTVDHVRGLDGGHELRKEQRYKVSTPVALVFGSDFSDVVHAWLENRSANGALIIVDPKALLPKRFVIVDRVDNLFDLAKVAWRREDKCGVMLVRNFDLSKPLADENAADDGMDDAEQSDALAV